MKKCLILSLILFLNACGICNHLPQEHVVVRDSVAVHIKDSINWIPIEKIVDVVAQYDTLNLETSLALAQSYVDTTTHTLKGKIENKQGAEFQYKEKIVYRYKQDTLWKDKPVPVPVEVEKIKEVVPRWAWYLLALFVLEAICVGIRIYIKLKLDNPSLLKKK